jgi:hypothetical protein
MAAAPVPPVSPAPEPAAPPMSEGARIINTFIAPSKTFTDLRRNASWWAPWILLSVVTILFFVVVGQKIGYRKVAENQIQASPKAAERLDRLQPADREQAMQRQAKGIEYFGYAFPVFILILNLIFAVLFYATYTFGVGTQISFKTTLAIVMYAALPGALKWLLATASVLAGSDPDSFSLRNPVATNPGYFLNPSDSPVLFSLASSLDLFLIWSLVLNALGFAYAAKVKRGTSFAVVFGLWLLFTLIGAGFAAAFS